MTMTNTFHLLFSYHRKSIFNWFITLILPVILLVIIVNFSNTIQQPNSSNGIFLGLPGVISSIGPLVGILTLTITLTDFKQSLFFKRLKTLPIKVFEFLYGLILYYLLTIIIVSLFLIGIATIIYYKKINFSWINFAWLIFSIILNGVISCLIGFTISYFINDFKISLIVSFIAFLLTFFLSGCFLPLYVIKSSNFLKIIALLIPSTYSSCLTIYSWYYFPPKYNGHELVNFKDYSLFDNFYWPLAISLLIVLFLTIVILLKNFISSRFYQKWKK